MAASAKGLVEFEFKDRKFGLIFDMAAIAEFEEATDLSILDVAEQMGGGARKPKLSTLGHLLRAGLLRLHPEITRDEAMAMVVDPAVMAAFGEGVSAAMPQQGDDGRAESAPRPRRGGGRKGK